MRIPDRNTRSSIRRPAPHPPLLHQRELRRINQSRYLIGRVDGNAFHHESANCTARHLIQAPREDGLIPEALDTGITQRARLLYSQPNFSNPTGQCLPPERRRALARQGSVPGAPCYANDVRRDTLRLSFVAVPPAQIDEGVARLARLIRAQA